MKSEKVTPKRLRCSKPISVIRHCPAPSTRWRSLNLLAETAAQRLGRLVVVVLREPFRGMGASRKSTKT